MSEINQPSTTSSSPGTTKRKKLSTKVDLTPMVDLGFLLITFFVFTTTMAEPTALKLFLPADGGIQMPVKETDALTLVPLSNNKVFYYVGQLPHPGNPGKSGITDFEPHSGIRKLIMSIQVKKLRESLAKKQDLMLIIKPLGTASYQNLVDILDEVTINGVKRYAIAELSKGETEYLASKEIR